MEEKALKGDNHMRKAVIVLLAAYIVLFASGCSGNNTIPTNTGVIGAANTREDGRTELIVATDVALSELNKIVSSFNAQSEDYYVRLVEYSGSEKTMDLLQTEIISGNAPDIYAFYFDASLSEVEPEIVFEDLFPYLDSDPEYGRETIFQGLFNALSASGHMYWLPYDYSIGTFIARESVVGNKAKTSMQELENIAAAQEPEVCVFPPWMSKATLLWHVTSFSIGRFVDEQIGTCNFNNPYFVKLIEKCNLQPEISPPDNDNMSVLTNETFQNIEMLSILRANYGNDFRFVGFPDEETNGSIFNMNLRLAVSGQSLHKDGAWEFVRSILSSTNQANATFLPSTQAEFNKRITQAVNGDYIAPHFGQVKIEQVDVDKLSALIDETRVLNGNNAVLRQIIQEECRSFFNGDRSAEKTAQIIQSRASLYISEHS